MPQPQPLQKIRKMAARVAPYLSASQRFARSLRLGSRDDLVRLGGEYGGHVVPEQLLGKRSVCYSAGVGNDISFDLALIDRFGCQVDAFDPTPAAYDFIESQRLPEGLRYHPHGIWSKDTYLNFFDHPAERGGGTSNYSATDVYGGRQSFRGPVRSLASVMRQLGDERIDLLKLDIEGAEYEVIGSIVEEQIPINVLTVEFHKDPTTKSMRRAVDDLARARLFPQHVDGYEVIFVRSPPLPPPRPNAPACAPGRARAGTRDRPG